MLDIEPNPATFFVVLVAGHFANTLCVWLVHFLQHRRILGVPFHFIHLKAHHDPELPRTDPDTHRLYVVLGHAHWLSMVILIALLYHRFLAPWMAATLIVDGLLLSGFLYYSHAEYDNAKSWLLRFEWFRRGRALHGIHHGRFESFDASRNYAFGGPLAGFLMDRLLGTYHEPPRRRLTSLPLSPHSTKGCGTCG